MRHPHWMNFGAFNHNDNFAVAQADDIMWAPAKGILTQAFLIKYSPSLRTRTENLLANLREHKRKTKKRNPYTTHTRLRERSSAPSRPTWPSPPSTRVR
mmetsp:Transcript_40502/g.101300  ORF Transcript_40502/g.101300 Transcript_40502/m.101300 type:complete len:99 (+) Transcript_40502:30-326(+)